MKLYLIRHAQAHPLGHEGAEDDAERPLTEAGFGQCQHLARGLHGAGVELKMLLTSPLLRARQTAEEMLKHWPEPRPELLECEGLAPGRKVRKLLQALRGVDSEEVGLVGHMPDLGRLAGWLIGDKEANIHLAKAGVAYLECDAGPRKGGGTLLWLVTPCWYR